MIRHLGAARGTTVLAAALAVAVPLSLVGPSSHADPSAADRTLAEGLFRDGRTLLAEGKVDLACGKFAESERLAPALGTLANLAACHEKQGRTATAWTEWSSVLAQATRANDRARASLARDRIRSLEPQVPKIVITCDAVPDGLVVRLDGTEMSAAALGTPLPVDPGEHEIELSAPKKRPWSQRVTIEKTATTKTITAPRLADEVAAPVGPIASASARPAASTSAPSPSSSAPTAVAPRPAPTTLRTEPPIGRADRAPSSEGDTRATIGWTALSVGVVGLGVGTYFGLQTLSKRSEADPSCPLKQCDATGQRLIDQARTDATWSTVSLAVGLVGLGLGGYLLLTGDDAGAKKAQSGVRVQVAPIAGRDGGGVILHGAF